MVVGSNPTVLAAANDSEQRERRDSNHGRPSEARSGIGFESHRARSHFLLRRVRLRRTTPRKKIWGTTAGRSLRSRPENCVRFARADALFRAKRRERTGVTVVHESHRARGSAGLERVRRREPPTRSVEPVPLVCFVDVQNLDHTDLRIGFENVVERGVGPADMYSGIILRRRRPAFLCHRIRTPASDTGRRIISEGCPSRCVCSSRPVQRRTRGPPP